MPMPAEQCTRAGPTLLSSGKRGREKPRPCPPPLPPPRTESLKKGGSQEEEEVLVDKMNQINYTLPTQTENCLYNQIFAILILYSFLIVNQNIDSGPH
jgi:hypothetical protein